MMFKPVENAEALLRKNGVFKPTTVWVDVAGRLFAKAGGGFIRLKENGSCSDNVTVIDVLAIDVPLFRDKQGRLCLSNFAGAVALAAPVEQKLLAAPDA